MSETVHQIAVGQTFMAIGDDGAPIECFCLTVDDYRKFLMSVEADLNNDWCEACGAVLFPDDEERATVGDVSGCWAYVTGDHPDHATECVRRRSMGK